MDLRFKFFKEVNDILWKIIEDRKIYLQKKPRVVASQWLSLFLSIATIFLISGSSFLYRLFPADWTILNTVRSQSYGQIVLVGAVIFVVIGIYQFSPLSIYFKRKQIGGRKITDPAENEFLSVVNEAVYQRLVKRYPNARKARIWLIDEREINAFALGYRDICLYRGLLQLVDVEQLEAILAHEYAHLYHRDTLGLLLIRTSYVASAFLLLYIFRWLIVMIFLIGFVFSLLSLGRRKSVFKAITDLGRNLFYRYYKFIRFLMAQVSKQQEYRADETALYLGFSQGLEAFFYMLTEMTYQPKNSFLKMLQSNHPSIKARLKNIQKRLEE